METFNLDGSSRQKKYHLKTKAQPLAIFSLLIIQFIVILPFFVVL
ncbi:MAG: hypothetical protein WA667_25995 [Candidatus Nitrosopolaris sp.]